MLLAATEPLLAPPDLRPLAERVFRALAVVRFASVPSLLAFAGPLGLRQEHIDVWIAAGLLHAGVVRPEPLSDREVAFVALAPRGARELSAIGLSNVEGVPPARMRRSAQTRAHDLGVGDVALALLALSRDGHIDLAGVGCDPKKFPTSAVIEERGRARRVPLEGDLYAIVRRDAGPAGLLVEVDRGTVSVERMARKYAGYLAWRRAGGPERDFGLKAIRVVTVAPDARRLERLRHAALAANDGNRSGFLLFALADDVTPAHADRLLEPVAHAVGSAGDRVPLVAAAEGTRTQ
jgi:hypothetical protein